MAAKVGGSSAPKRYGSEDQAPASKDTKVAPPADEVEQFHQNSDVDIRRESLHHTLGPANSQAAAGDHNHDGGDSVLLLSGVTITGSRGGNAALVSIISALVKLGATDSSTV